MRSLAMHSLKILIACGLLFAANTYAAGRVDLNGTWLGTWTSYRSPEYNGTAKVTLTQKGNVITGSGVFSNTKCSPKRKIRGKIMPGSGMVYLKVYPMAHPTKKPISTSWGVVSLKNNAISFVYTFGAGACAGDSGTWFISKDQPYKPHR